jgi:hypothetical protein
MEPIPVICDRCRAEGEAGEGDFADLAGLLDFEPVPRRPRVDGWSPGAQRAFIAALAVTGSPARAASAIGKHAFGAEQLRKAKGGEGFDAAWDKALALSAERGAMRLDRGVRLVIGAQPPLPPLPPEPPEPPAAEAEPPLGPLDELGFTAEDRAKIAAFQSVFDNYVMRLQLEREARLEGRIAAADFYIRQVTVLEISLDLMARGAGRDAILIMQKLRDGRHKINDIAETPMSRILDDYRQEFWDMLGEPRRPPPLPPSETIEVDGLKRIKGPHIFGANYEEQRRAQLEGYAAAAREQVEWERTAREEAAAWRARLEAEAEASVKAAQNPSPCRGEGNGGEAGEGEGTTGEPGADSDKP